MDLCFKYQYYVVAVQPNYCFSAPHLGYMHLFGGSLVPYQVNNMTWPLRVTLLHMQPPFIADLVYMQPYLFS